MADIPNSFLTEEEGHIASTALSMLRDSLILGRLVWRDAENDFHGRVGNLVNIEIPGHAGGAMDIAATPGDLDKGSKITAYNGVKDQSQPLKLTNHFAHPVKLSAKEMTLDLDNFAARVLRRQVKELAELVEASVASLMNTEIAAATVNATEKEALLDAITDAGVFLDENGVSEDGRIIVASPAAYGLLVKNEILTRVNESGTSGALRKAEVGEIRGFTVYKSNFLKDGMLCMTREAFVAAVVAPAAAMGTKSATANEGGYSLRWLQDFDMGSVSDVSVLDTFFGAVKTDPQETYDGGELYRCTAIKTVKGEPSF
ncbi:P22 phage major capsid protein family protein [Kitasatospora sp. McL0602]|uniref:P22 phage major capsid protein family protein n=1 Tax=Kitasatospora sp. McL0602 TaxID=3439530 RepID=UPI003F8C0F80